MPHSYSVSGCTNRSDRETGLSYFKLPLKRKAVLKQWIHVIRRTNLPINTNTCVCSIHFLNATGHLLRPNEVPSLHLPQKSTGNKTATRKPLKERPSFEKLLRRKRTNQKVNDKTGSDEINVSVCSKCKSGQREGSSIENWNICFMKKSKRTPGCCRSLLVQSLLYEEKQKNSRLSEELANAKGKLFRLDNIKNSDFIKYVIIQGLVRSLHSRVFTIILDQLWITYVILMMVPLLMNR